MFRKRAPVIFDPSTDSTLAVWVDFNDSSTNSILDTGGGSVSDGETLGTIKSKKGTARNFTQWGSSARPTWAANGINGLGAALFNVAIMVTQTTMSDFNSMSGATVMVVHKVNSQRSGSAGLDCVFSTTQADVPAGSHFRAQMYVASRSDAINRVGGRRLVNTSFQYITSTIIPPSSGGIVTGVYDWANAKASSYEGGIRDTIDASFQTAGNTEATEPFAMSIGGVAIESGTTFGDACNSYIGEILMWKSAKTPDELFAAHHYLRRKWKIN